MGVKENVLVTGGAGYVGSNICKKLLNSDFVPIVVDNLSTGNRDMVKFGPFFEGDISDDALIKQVYKRYPFDAVIHCAASAEVAESVSRPDIYYENNFCKAISFLNTLDQLGVRKFIFSSTCATYGTPLKTPISVGDRQEPINPYGRSKLFLEEVLKDYSSVFDWKVAAMRYFNVAGAEVDLEIGERHEPETHILPLVIRAAYDENFTLTLNGDDYQTRDGTCIRDYIHVSDLADAHIKAYQYLSCAEDKFTAFNLGYGQGFSILELIKSVEKISNHKVKFRLGSRRKGDPATLVADSEESIRQLDWQPEFADLDKIVRTAVSWYEKDTVFRFNSDL
jgi:UDP-glucose 4-epimerase